MTNLGPGDKPTKSQKREHARELARQTRAKEQAAAKRRKWIVQGSVTLGVIAIAAVIALVVVTGTKPATTAAGPLNMLSDGILISGDGTTTSAVTTAAIQPDADPVATDSATIADTVNIVEYVDYLCPYCGQFESTNSANIDALVSSGTATLEIHPISILDNSSLGTEYSTRAANAAACVANFDPDNYLAVSDALFSNQPEEGTSGLTDDELISLVETAGVTATDVSSCITDQTFADWVAESTQRALDGPLPNTSVEAVTGTPTVLVNGEQYSGALDDADAFLEFVQAQATTTE